ncbi:MAG TPA: HNH endonuclease signature motif containing protein [Polyangiaceae bacterium]|nr:HNH endonuclease signature motif containing protein [Polyangiaceae bacterium]
MAERVEELPAAWLVLAFHDRRRLAAGAEDDERSPTSQYDYDTNVPNHRNVAVGDVLLIRGPRELEACARVRHIDETSASRRRLKCPTCGSSEIQMRDGREARYRCNQGHRFFEPITERIVVKRFIARFDDSYVPARGAIGLPELRAACPHWHGQHAIQPIDLAQLHAKLVAIPGFRERVLEQVNCPQLAPDDASLIAPYVPGHSDMRALSHRQLRERRGPARFRRALIARYGAQCMVSGCTLRDLIETAHIRPYRTPDYSAVENGLLLRSDLHTLFDLDLLGIQAETLAVHLHPSARQAGYEAFEGTLLQCGNSVPSPAALELRWSDFMRRLRSP